MMNEPYLTEFKRLIREGAASQDIHDAAGADDFASTSAGDDAFVQREVERVEMHQRSLAMPLERAIGQARRVLDFGCGTGGATLALALSELGVEEIVGVDANATALRAAEVRAAGYGLAPPRVRFVHVPAGERLPFDDGAFDLVTTVSVLEFITELADRDACVAELRRVVRPGGYLYIATPKRRVREYHSRRLLGDLLRKPGMPWASTRRQVSRWADGWQRISFIPRRLETMPGVRRLPRPVLDRGSRLAVAVASDWRKILLRRPT